MPARRDTRRGGLRLFRGWQPEYALAFGEQLHAGRSAEDCGNMPGIWSQDLYDSEYRSLRGRSGSYAGGTGRCQGGGSERNHRLGHGGDHILPEDRAGGAHLDPAQRVECRGAAVLFTVRRRDRAGEGTQPASGKGNPSSDRERGHQRSFR